LTERINAAWDAAISALDTTMVFFESISNPRFGSRRYAHVVKAAMPWGAWCWWMTRWRPGRCFLYAKGIVADYRDILDHETCGGQGRMLAEQSAGQKSLIRGPRRKPYEAYRWRV